MCLSVQWSMLLCLTLLSWRHGWSSPNSAHPHRTHRSVTGAVLCVHLFSVVLELVMADDDSMSNPIHNSVII